MASSKLDAENHAIMAPIQPTTMEAAAILPLTLLQKSPTKKALTGAANSIPEKVSSVSRDTFSRKVAIRAIARAITTVASLPKRSC